MATWSNVESAFMARSGRQPSYEGEAIPVVEVLNIYELGKIVALEFMEWVRQNPKGVVALPTGRTPEYFIKTLGRYKSLWSDPAVMNEVRANGYTHDDFPDMSGLQFVMLDEFFPMYPTHRNAFCLYIKTYYLPLLGIPHENVLDFDFLARNVLTLDEMDEFKGLDVDLSLLTTTEPLNEKQQRQQLVLRKVQQYCDVFEEKLASLGGIGFFLGGIGPDGHIAFNQEGCSHTSRTRLVNFNYMTAAAAAGDLGGIEIARGKAAVTIGLATITSNKNAKIIIMAAGEGKATVCREAIEEPVSEQRPSSILHGNANARFYLTHGAASLLTARRAEKIGSVAEDVCINWALQHLSDSFNKNVPANLLPVPRDFLIAETLIHRVSLASQKPVHLLDASDLIGTGLESSAAPAWLRDPLKFKVMSSCVSRRLRERVEAGLISASPIGKSILHTAPHHDDIMLSYHGAMHEMLGRQPSVGINEKRKAVIMEDTVIPKPARGRSTSGSFVYAQMSASGLGEAFNSNVNHFAYLTSGFHSVNDSFIKENVDAVLSTVTHTDMFSTAVPLGTTFLHAAVVSGEITRDYDDLMTDFRKAFFAKDEQAMDQIENVIFLRKVAEVWNLTLTMSYQELSDQLAERVHWINEEYVLKHQPGDAIPKELQLLKGCMRESEVDRVWALSRMPMNRVHHLRSKFYTDDFFTPMPTLEGDALPMANLIRARQPDLITVAFDPEGTGPDTHYKVLQVVAAGLRVSIARKDLENPNPMIWGYRNVWFIFTPAEATIMIPCSSADLDLMHDTFMHCFTTQKKASYPSPHYDGSFSAWSRHLQIQHRNTLNVLLGEAYFSEHSDPRVRDSAGFIFLKAMFAEEFLREVEELKSKFENVVR